MKRPRAHHGSNNIVTSLDNHGGDVADVSYILKEFPVALEKARLMK